MFVHPIEFKNLTLTSFSSVRPNCIWFCFSHHSFRTGVISLLIFHFSGEQWQARDAARAARSLRLTKIWHHSAVVCPSDLITYEQILHLEESREFTREQHANGDASARDDNLRSGVFFIYFLFFCFFASLAREGKK